MQRAGVPAPEPVRERAQRDATRMCAGEGETALLSELGGLLGGPICHPALPSCDGQGKAGGAFIGCTALGRARAALGNH